MYDKAKVQMGHAVNQKVDRYAVHETDAGHAIWDRQEQKSISGGKAPRKINSSSQINSHADKAYQGWLSGLHSKVRKMNAENGPITLPKSGSKH